MEVMPGCIVTANTKDNGRNFILETEGEACHLLGGGHILISDNEPLFVLYVKGRDAELEGFLLSDGVNENSTTFHTSKALVLLQSGRLGWIWTNWVDRILVNT